MAKEYLFRFLRQLLNQVLRFLLLLRFVGLGGGVVGLEFNVITCEELCGVLLLVLLLVVVVCGVLGLSSVILSNERLESVLRLAGVGIALHFLRHGRSLLRHERLMVGSALRLPLLGLDVENAGLCVTEGLVDVVADVRLPLTGFALLVLGSFSVSSVISGLGSISELGPTGNRKVVVNCHFSLRRDNNVRSAGVGVVTDLSLELFKLVAGLLNAHFEVLFPDDVALSVFSVELILQFTDSSHVADANLEGLDLLLREFLNRSGLLLRCLRLELRTGHHGLRVQVLIVGDFVKVDAAVLIVICTVVLILRIARRSGD